MSYHVKMCVGGPRYWFTCWADHLRKGQLVAAGSLAQVRHAMANNIRFAHSISVDGNALQDLHAIHMEVLVARCSRLQPGETLQCGDKIAYRITRDIK